MFGIKRIRQILPIVYKPFFFNEYTIYFINVLKQKNRIIVRTFWTELIFIYKKKFMYKCQYCGKEFERQNIIINELNCEFYRYNEYKKYFYKINGRLV